MRAFIPSFHFVKPSEKLTDDFCEKVVNYHYHHSHNVSLLEGKNVEEIHQYSIGDYDMTPFENLFKSIQNQRKQQGGRPNVIGCDSVSTEQLDFQPIPLIPAKLNSAVSVVSKIPIEVEIKASDAMAARKKEEDLHFLRTKPMIEKDLKEFSEEMGLGPMDLGATQHSATPYSDSPYGLDLNDPEEQDVFANIVYTLGVEAAYETCLQHWWELKNAHQVEHLEVKDTFLYGVCCHQTSRSDITRMPELEYVYPGEMLCPESMLPDFSDNTHRIRVKKVTVQEMFNKFGTEIGNEDDLYDLINNKESGYGPKNNQTSPVAAKDFETFKVELLYFEVKSIDWVGVSRKKGRNGFQTFTEDEEKITEKLWGQNTYCFWWLKNTKKYFHKHRLDSSRRKKGKESQQTFSTSIFKSQHKSAIELSISENKKATVAEIKLQHAIIMSLPPGKFIDLRFIRGAFASLSDEKTDYSLQSLIDLAFERNVVIGDSSGFDKADTQLRPLMDIAGGLKRAEIEGYLEVIAQASLKISQFTGINEQLTGQSPNPEGLVGMQKLLINAALNALYYCNEAVSHQATDIFTHWGNIFKQCIEDGGAARKQVEDIVGAKKANLIDMLDDVPLHDIGILVNILQREEARARFEQSLQVLKQNKILNETDEFMLRAMRNPKDQMAMLAVKEKKAVERLMQQEMMKMQQMQAIEQQRGQNMAAAVAAQGENKVKEVYAKGDVQAKIIQLTNQLGLGRDQFLQLAKKSLQNDRLEAQADKAVQTVAAKSNAQQQMPIGVA